MIKFFKTPEEEIPYQGNVWGWKFSLLGLALILLFCVGIAYRYYVLGVPLNEDLKYDKPDTFMIETSSDQ